MFYTLFLIPLTPYALSRHYDKKLRRLHSSGKIPDIIAAHNAKTFYKILAIVIAIVLVCLYLQPLIK